MKIIIIIIIIIIKHLGTLFMVKPYHSVYKGNNGMSDKNTEAKTHKLFFHL